MATYVSLLRGVNVGGRCRLTMAELRRTLVEIGFSEVRTYVQSGNVVLAADAGPEEVRSAIEGALRGVLGLAGASALVRTGEEMAEVAASNPFIAGRRDPAALHVTFLDGSWTVEELDEIAARWAGNDLVAPGRGAVYLWCPNGYGRTKLGNSLFERELNVVATTRNWRTVSKLVEMSGCP